MWINGKGDGRDMLKSVLVNNFVFFFFGNSFWDKSSELFKLLYVLLNVMFWFLLDIDEFVELLNLL